MIEKIVSATERTIRMARKISRIGAISAAVGVGVVVSGCAPKEVDIIACHPLAAENRHHGVYDIPLRPLEEVRVEAHTASVGENGRLNINPGSSDDVVEVLSREGLVVSSARDAVTFTLGVENPDGTRTLHIVGDCH